MANNIRPTLKGSALVHVPADLWKRINSTVDGDVTEWIRETLDDELDRIDANNA